MAGEGYRIWTPGEVITANNIQGFLMDQSVQVYADAGARDSALTGYLAEGMICYLEDSNSVFAYTGSSWEEVGADPAIFTQGTSGQFLKSLGTAGVVFDTVPQPGAATPTVRGLIFGSSGTVVGSSVGSTPDDYPDNVVIGFGSGTAITKTTFLGNRNTIMGQAAGTALTTGRENVIVGNAAGNQVVGGDYNVIMGSRAGSSFNVSGLTAIGDSAGRSISGANNTTVGGASFATVLCSGSNNTGLGFFVGSTQAMLGSNNTLLGANAAASSDTVSNQITLGNGSVTSLRCNVTSISSLSDQRDKTDIEALPVGLDFVNTLKPVRFTWNTRIPESVTLPDGKVIKYSASDVRRGVPDIGFIAQDLVEAEDDLEGHDWLQLTLRDNPDKLEATQGRLIPILVKAIQELSAEVAALKAQNNA